MKLIRPIVLAPMAGGITTPELCAAVADAGGLPFLAVGHLPVNELINEIKKYESLSKNDYGINIFFPSPSLIKKDGSAKENNLISHDDYQKKINVAAESNCTYISFIFGHPEQETINYLKSKGKKVILYATSKKGIDYIEKSNADIIGIQGPKGGGYQASVSGIDSEDGTDIEGLINYAVSISDKSILAGGGVSSANDVLRLIRLGASAVQVGTLFLLADEAGTKPAHRNELLSLRDRKTALTNANDVTKKVRLDTNEEKDVGQIPFWAGAGVKKIYSASAKSITENLTPYIITSNEKTIKNNDKSICVIGAGPRGIALIERLISNFNKSGEPVSVYWFDDTIHGAGRVWNPYNPSHLLMNSVCSQISAFPDKFSGFGNEYISGPTLFEWLQSSDSFEWLKVDDDLLAEKSKLTKNSYASRPLYGSYLVWATKKIISSKKKNITLVLKNDRVSSIEKSGDKRKIKTLVNESYDVDFVLMALGHINSDMSDNERHMYEKLKNHGVHYIPCGDATTARSSKILEKKNALFFGLGLTFFDYLEMLTTQRGGKYSNKDGVVVYSPSGKEPNIYITSLTGVPYYAKGVNEKEPTERWIPRFLTEEYLSSLKANKREISFGRDIWKMIVKELELSYTLSELKSDKEEESIKKALICGGDFYKKKRASLGLNPYGFPWKKVLKPEIDIVNCYSLEEYQKTISEYLDNDIKEAEGGNKSNPFKTASDALRDIRNEVRMSVMGGSISDRSFQEEFNYFYNPVYTVLSVGPPVRRIKELNALIKAGIAKILPSTLFTNYNETKKRVTISFKEPFFEDITVDYIIDARQQKLKISNCSDPLIKALYKNGIISSHSYSNGMESGVINISHEKLNIIDSKGNLDSRIFCYGIPTITWGTALTIRPFVDSTIFLDAQNIVKMTIKSNR